MDTMLCSRDCLQTYRFQVCPSIMLLVCIVLPWCVVPRLPRIVIIISECFISFTCIVCYNNWRSHIDLSVLLLTLVVQYHRLDECLCTISGLTSFLLCVMTCLGLQAVLVALCESLIVLVILVPDRWVSDQTCNVASARLLLFKGYILGC